MKTKVHELLGVEVGEVFAVGDRENKYALRNDGALMGAEDKGMRFSCLLAHLINNPSLIVHKPKPLTDEQRKVLETLLVLGYEWVAKEKDGEVYIYTGEPYIPEGASEWRVGSNDDDVWYFTNKTRCLFPLLSDWKVLLDVRKALG